jgi:hypothetical protein
MRACEFDPRFDLTLLRLGPREELFSLVEMFAQEIGYYYFLFDSIVFIGLSPEKKT